MEETRQRKCPNDGEVLKITDEHVGFVVLTCSKCGYKLII